MSTYRVGSNGYVKTPKFGLLEGLALFSVIVYAGSVLMFAKPAHADSATEFLKQFTFGVEPALNLDIQPTMAGLSAELQKPATVENVVAEIARVFGPEGKSVVKEALDISMCESGWRADAYNFNTNKTSDFNIFQVNSIWTKVFGNLFQTNWLENIRVAHEIYLRSHSFNAWVCSRKLGYAK